MVAVHFDCSRPLFSVLASKPIVRFWFGRNIFSRQWCFPQLLHKAVLYLLPILTKWSPICKNALFSVAFATCIGKRPSKATDQGGLDVAPGL